MSFPTSIPSYAGFSSTHTLSQDNHASQHNSEQTDITALGTKVGTGASTPVVATVLRGNGTGTSNWAQVSAPTDITGILAQANGGTGTNVATGTGPVVYGTNPTITAPVLSQPTISDFTSATHNHQNAVGGGTLNGANAIQSGTLTSSQVNSTIAQIAAGGKFKIDCGTAAASASPDSTISFNVTFNTAPLVFVTSSTATAANVFGVAWTITTTNFKLRAFDGAGQKTTESFSWMALGT